MVIVDAARVLHSQALEQHRGWRKVRTTAGVSNATTTFASIAPATGQPLSIPVAAGSDYLVEADLIVDITDVNAGLKLAANGPASPAAVAGMWQSGDATGVGGSTFNGYDQATTLTVPQFTTSNLAKVWILFRNGANAGTLALRFAVNVAIGTATVKPGSLLRWQQIA